MIQVIQKPAALFLLCDPVTDHNSVFSKSCIHYFEKTVRKTHRVFIEVVQGDGNPDRYLSIASEKAGQRIDLFFKFGHGNVDGQRLALEKDHTAQDIEPATYRDHMTVTGCVYYIGCKLAGLAQETAKIARIRAFGFQHSGEWGEEVVIHEKGRYRIIECSQRKHSFYDEFDPDGHQEPAPFSSAEIYPRICELALLDDPQAQHVLAHHADTIEERRNWRRRAAENGHIYSREFALFNESIMTLNLETITKWFPEILEDLCGTKAIRSADKFARNGFLDFADQIYRKVYRTDRRLDLHLSAARGIGQIYHRKGEIRNALRAYAVAAGKSRDAAEAVFDEMYKDGLPANGITGRDLIALYRKLGILERVLEWAKESALYDDSLANEWLSEIYEHRDAFAPCDLEGARILAQFYEGWDFNKPDMPKAIEMYKILVSLSCKDAPHRLTYLEKLQKQEAINIAAND